MAWYQAVQCLACKQLEYESSFRLFLYPTKLYIGGVVWYISSLTSSSTCASFVNTVVDVSCSLEEGICHLCRNVKRMNHNICEAIDILWYLPSCSLLDGSTGLEWCLMGRRGKALYDSNSYRCAPDKFIIFPVFFRGVTLDFPKNFHHDTSQSLLRC